MTRRRRIDRRGIAPLALAMLAILALSQIDLMSWLRTTLDPALSDPVAIHANLQGTAHIIDGDTLDINGTRIRLHGIDAPESKQTCEDARGTAYRCGAQATAALADRVGSQIVTCAGHEQDRYGRIIATCSVGGADLGAFMVIGGHALAYRRYSTAYIGEEILAKRDGVGIWQGVFTAPWDWRRGQR